VGLRGALGTVDSMQRFLAPVADRWAWVGTALRVQERFGELHGGYLAAAVTLNAFLSLFPLILVGVAVIGWISSGSPDLPERIASGLGLTGDAAKAVTSAVATAEESRAAASVVGVAGLLWSGLGLVAALQYALDSAWQVTGRGFRDKAVGLAWLVGAALILASTFALTAALNFLPGPAAPAALLAGLAIDVALWMWTMKVLVNRDVGWRPLLPGVILGAVGLEVLKAVGAIYVPRAVSSSSALYGSIGVVFAVLAWLLFFGRLIVYAAVLNVVRWEEEHGTVTVELELPRLPGETPLEGTRAGEAASP
jgi:membrane protein